VKVGGLWVKNKRIRENITQSIHSHFSVFKTTFEREEKEENGDWRGDFIEQISIFFGCFFFASSCSFFDGFFLSSSLIVNGFFLALDLLFFCS
jgi:hypothetical protein